MKEKLREIGVKRLIVMAVVIILSVVIAIVAIVTAGKDDKPSTEKEDVIEFVQEMGAVEEEAAEEEEEVSSEMDYDTPEATATETETTGTNETSKEVVTKGNAGNESKNELSEKQKSFNEEFKKIYNVHSQHKTQFEGLGIDTDLKCAEIYFNNDNEVDYLFHGVEIYYLLIAGENGYYVYDGLITGTHSSEYYYIAKTGTIIHFATGYYNDGGYDVYKLNDSYEEEYQYYIGEECIMDSSNNPLLDENGELQKIYLYSDKNERFEISAEEYNKRLNELESKWTSLYDIPYKSLEKFSWYKELAR